MRLGNVCVVWVVVSLAGCGEGPPPLDELPLRDTLRADPEVVGDLPDDARARLAERLEAARARDGASDDVAGAGDDPAALVAAVDRARAERNAEALIVGAVAAGTARPLPDRTDRADAPPLPSFEGGAGVTTADAEAAALAGDAGATVRALMKASGAARLRRVTGWPTGAVAVGDTVYVNAAWLVALAPGRGGHPDAGAGASAAPTPGGPAAGISFPRVTAPDTGASGAPRPQQSEQSPLTSTSAAYDQPDGGAQPPPPPPDPPPDDGASCWDACGTCADACASSPPYDDGSSDSCGGDGSSDSCDSTSDDGSGDSCGGTTDDGSADSCSSTGDGSESGCQITRAHPRCRGRARSRGGARTEAWLLAPLGFLMMSQRRRGA